MALTLVERYEYEENGITYVYSKYQRGDGGYTEDRHMKSDELSMDQSRSCTLEDLRQQISQTNKVQRGRTQLTGTSVTIAIDVVDPSAATAAIDVQGCDTPYAYTLAEDALTVVFAEPVQAWINWEVQG